MCSVRGVGSDFFSLDAQKFKQFTTFLDTPPNSNPGLERLMAIKILWDAAPVETGIFGQIRLFFFEKAWCVRKRLDSCRVSTWCPPCRLCTGPVLSPIITVFRGALQRLLSLPGVRLGNLSLQRRSSTISKCGELFYAPSSCQWFNTSWFWSHHERTPEEPRSR